MSRMRDPYAVLGVKQDARDDEIKAAWRARAKSVHPDHNRDDPQAAARFAEIGAAYELLKDPRKRSRYDARRRKGEGEDGQTIMQQRRAAQEAAERAKAAREEAARVMEELARANAQRAAKAAQNAQAAAGGSAEASGESPESVVNRIFGAGDKAKKAEAKAADAKSADAKPNTASNPSATAETRTGPKPEPDATAGTETTQKAEDAGNDASHAASVPLPVQAVELISYWIRRLRGIEPAPEKAPDIVTDVVVTIDDLLASRRVTTTLFDGRDVNVQLQPGMTDEHVVRIEGQGHRFQGMQRGDVRVTLKIADDPNFNVEGFDIHTILPVTLENAVLGCESTVESPEGPVAITIPPWSDSNRSVRVEGRGLPETAEKRGDLVVELRLLLWEKPDDKVTDLMRHMREGLFI